MARLRFENVRPDGYRLIIKGRGVAATNLAIDVTDADVDLGTLRIDGLGTATGRIEGRVWRPKDKGGGPWAFANGYVVGESRVPGLDAGNDRRMTFQADENGCFTVERVPVGLTTVGFASYLL